jgi:hypothetical protein
MSVFRYHNQEQVPSGRRPGFGAGRVSPSAHRPDTGRIAGRYVSATCPVLNGPAGVAVTAVPFAVARAGHRAPH